MVGSALRQAEEVLSRLVKVYFAGRRRGDELGSVTLPDEASDPDWITEDLLNELRREETRPAAGPIPCLKKTPSCQAA